MDNLLYPISVTFRQHASTEMGRGDSRPTQFSSATQIMVPLSTNDNRSKIRSQWRWILIAPSDSEPQFKNPVNNSNWTLLHTDGFSLEILVPAHADSLASSVFLCIEHLITHSSVLTIRYTSTKNICQPPCRSSVRLVLATRVLSIQNRRLPLCSHFFFLLLLPSPSYSFPLIR